MAPLTFVAQLASAPTPMLTLIGLATLICLAYGAPIWLRTSIAGKTKTVSDSSEEFTVS